MFKIDYIVLRRGNIKIIQVDNGDFLEAYDELIECRKAGEFAILQVSERNSIFNTTDDIPDEFMSMSKEEIYQHIVQAGARRSTKMQAARLGVYGSDPVEHGAAISEHIYNEGHSRTPN